ncbi:flagellar biosynthetic protein FliR [Falsiroseomonas stagni]|uniref:Flagellar biosynthetic protein FliR n=1 Tax=Falsiroseomonas stagni DSM 19981 TaxID=1123062 RepID=A0A1I4CG07_9PROT|nr:flagellar biosynthetic protein FliR [Falsiroseomonas stagni]SFK79703.1 flagellar biosynthetic protein FliR [Falsiroseomonas stagni DSM 19981]
MTEADHALLQMLPGLVFQAALVFARLGAAVMLLPGLGEAEVPAPLRLGLGLALVALLLPVLAPGLPPMPDDLADMTRLLVTEIVIGLWIGTLARILVLAFAMAGQAVATLIGLSSLFAFDASLGMGGTALGRAFALMAAVLVLSTGLYQVPLAALAESYAVMPAGAPFPTGSAALAVARMGADSLDLALRIAAPFVVGAVLLNVALGLLARLAPQVQTFFIAVPGQILAGLGLLALLAPPMIATLLEALRTGFATLPGVR